MLSTNSISLVEKTSFQVSCSAMRARVFSTSSGSFGEGSFPSSATKCEGLFLHALSIYARARKLYWSFAHSTSTILLSRGFEPRPNP